MSKVVYELKFGRAGIKRWIEKYCFNRYFCRNVELVFILKEDRGQGVNMVQNYGHTSFIKL